jgi:hypothetical protein
VETSSIMERGTGVETGPISSLEIGGGAEGGEGKKMVE